MKIKLKKDSQIPKKSGWCFMNAGYDKQIIKDLNVSCDHKEGWFDKHKECRKEDFACKEILDCAECGAGFKYDKEFLDKQRRINKNNNNK